MMIVMRLIKSVRNYNVGQKFQQYFKKYLLLNYPIIIITMILQVIIVDNYHKVASEATGDNYHLNLDGILYLGQHHTSISAYHHHHHDHDHHHPHHHHHHHHNLRGSESEHVPRSSSTSSGRVWLPGPLIVISFCTPGQNLQLTSKSLHRVRYPIQPATYL